MSYMFSVRRFFKSFADAGRGLRYVFKQEQNFRVQLLAAVILVCLIIFLPLRLWETVLLVMLIMMVLTMELLNTAFEHFTDLFKPRIHPYAGLIKDIMAGAVLITSIGALIIGYLILMPHFLSLLK